MRWRVAAPDLFDTENRQDLNVTITPCFFPQQLADVDPWTVQSLMHTEKGVMDWVMCGQLSIGRNGLTALARHLHGRLFLKA